MYGEFDDALLNRTPPPPTSFEFLCLSLVRQTLLYNFLFFLSIFPHTVRSIFFPQLNSHSWNQSSMSSCLDRCQKLEGFMFTKEEPPDYAYEMPRTPHRTCNFMVVAKTKGENSDLDSSPSPYKFYIKPNFHSCPIPSSVQPHQPSPPYLLKAVILFSLFDFYVYPYLPCLHLYVYAYLLCLLHTPYAIYTPLCKGKMKKKTQP